MVKALGAALGISKSEVSTICAVLDQDLEVFRTCRLEGAFPYVFCDATYLKARVKGRVVSRAVVTATRVTSIGDRQVLGVEVRRQRGRSVLDGIDRVPRSGVTQPTAA